jgi:hypothetical protein
MRVGPCALITPSTTKKPWGIDGRFGSYGSLQPKQKTIIKRKIKPEYLFVITKI